MTLGVAPSNSALTASNAAADIVQALIPIGSMLPWTALEASIPAGYAIAAGQAISRAANPALNSIYSTASYPYGAGDGSTTFNLPDMRGRVLMALDNMGGTDAGRIATANTLGLAVGAETHTLTIGEMPAHSHGGVTGFFDTNHAHTGTTSTDPGHTHAFSTYAQFSVVVPGGSTFGINASFQTGVAVDAAGDHTHTFDTGNQSTGTPNHQHSLTSAGSGTAFSMMQPSLFMNWIVRIV